MRSIVVYGAGGLAREVEWLLRRINERQPSWQFEGYVVTDRTALTDRDSSDQVVGDEAWLLQQRDLCVAMAVGTPSYRVEIGRRLSASLSDSLFPTLVDPSAIYDRASCAFEPGVIVTAGCILTVNVALKRFAFINLDCTIGHESIVGEGSVLNPSVNISGGVSLGDGVLVGTGAQILQYLHVGEGATVGSGAVVVKNVADFDLVVGVPAKPRATAKNRD